MNLPTLPVFTLFSERNSSISPSSRRNSGEFVENPPSQSISLCSLTIRLFATATTYNFARYLTKFISLQPLLLIWLATSRPQRVYPPISTQTIGSCFFLKLLEPIAVTSSDSRPLLSRAFQSCFCLRAVSSRLAFRTIKIIHYVCDVKFGHFCPRGKSVT